ncbi:hypothetical protein [Salegentibacter salarius]|uniref:Uncharacterized protein n=1 Tax=Salegentibacter salarius TaxID=435906 RepID=A0A2N0TQG0_9FLAO|nr:hypothetical protein [Salegentibacter salarius]OEY71728.1 hypothetical protein BHS39_15055 [Salegentibacter salarius]PKD16964.1 hypothetical protein APR40_15025 [Salegentibacter salarius]SLJ89767.1 hypothetical protein SAMN05660445_00865 [Salegentibacter salarius]
MIENGLNREKIKFGMIACFLTSLFFLYQHFWQDTVVENNDLVSFSGNLENYVFENYNSGIRYDLKNYVLKLENSPDTYQIGADEIWLFDKNNFINEIQIGEEVLFQIPKEQEKHRFNNGNLPIYGISRNDIVFLNSKEVLREKRAPTSLVISLILMLAAFSLFFLFRKTAEPKKLQPTTYKNNA